MSEKVRTPDPSSVVSLFRNLTADLEPFVKVDDLKLCFDRHGNLYLQGDDFQEQIQTGFGTAQEFQSELRSMLAKHRSRQRNP
jgi:hypothetical protein